MVLKWDRINYQKSSKSNNWLILSKYGKSGKPTRVEFAVLGSLKLAKQVKYMERVWAEPEDLLAAITLSWSARRAGVDRSVQNLWASKNQLS
jgi:hypothetical protein